MSIPIGTTIDEGVYVPQPIDNGNTGASAQSGHDPKRAAVQDDPDETIGVLGPQVGEWKPERAVRDW